MINPEKIIHSINIEDIQTVAEQELDRKLTARKFKLVEGSIVRLGNCERASLLFFEIMNICLMAGRSW